MAASPNFRPGCRRADECARRRSPFGVVAAFRPVEMHRSGLDAAETEYRRGIFALRHGANALLWKEARDAGPDLRGRLRHHRGSSWCTDPDPIFFNCDMGIDHWVVRDFPATMGALNPGRMMPTTAFCFVLMGAALFTDSGLIPRRFGFALEAGLSAALVMIGVLAFGGFALEKLFGPRWNLLGMSLSGITAAAGFLILGSGLLALLQSKGVLNWSLDRLTTVGFGLGILLTVLTTASAFTFAGQMLETNKRVTHRQDFLKEIQQCMTGLVELASSERAYTIIGDESLLNEREQKKTTLKEHLSHVHELTAGNPNQQRSLDRLENLILQRVDFEEKVIATGRDQGLTKAREMIATRTGLNFSHEISELFKQN